MVCGDAAIANILLAPAKTGKSGVPALQRPAKPGPAQQLNTRSMPGLPKHIPHLAGKVRLRNTPLLKFMAATDLVPCFYTGQDYRWERPAKLEMRLRVRQWKDEKLGKFIENGKAFLFSKTIIQAAPPCNGPLGRGNLLPFARRTTGEPLHYSVPMAGDVGIRLHQRTLIQASGRNLFARRSHRELFPAFAAQ